MSDLYSLLEEVAPEIKRTKDTEGSILKVASAHNLAPAQLEKFAHLVNAMKTLNFLEKSANRGATFPLVDPQNLLDKYTRFNPEEEIKVAYVSPDTCLDEYEPVRSIPDFFALPGEQVKAASGEQIEPPVSRSAVKRDLPEFENEVYNFELLKKTAFDLRETCRETLQEFSQFLYEHPEVDFAGLERDALDTHGESVKRACGKIADWYERYTGRTIKRASADVPAKRRLVRDPHRKLATIRELQENLEMLDAAEYLIAEDERRLTKLAKTSADTSADTDTDSRPKPRSQGPGNSRKRGGGSQDKGDASFWDNLGDVANDAESGWKAAPKVELKWLPSISDILENVEAQLPTNNKAQQRVDYDYGNAQAHAVLQRLVTTDPVISQADENLISAIADSIHQSSPEVARDVNLMRFALREALQYDGLDTTRYKDLLSIHELKGKGNKLDREDRDDKYKIS